MRAKGGIAYLLSAFWLIGFLCAPLPVMAASSNTLPFFLAGAQTSMENQMVGEKPASPRAGMRPASSLYPDNAPSLQVNPDGAASLRLPYNLEMNISVLYKPEPSPLDQQRLVEPTLFFKSAMDYRVLPNLQVGLSSYLYRPTDENFAFMRPFGTRLGFGPELKYDLGRWSFLLKSQVETGQRGDALQNWFRVWYAF